MRQRGRIELLGHFRVSCDAQAEPIRKFATKKADALLAYLALSGGEASRDVLAALFWPEADAPRKSLSMALNALRKGLGDDSLLVLSRDAARLNSEAFTTDVADCEAALHSAAQARTDAQRITALETALALYRGPFLPAHVGLNSVHAPDWIQERQNRLIGASAFRRGASSPNCWKRRDGRRRRCAAPCWQRKALRRTSVSQKRPVGRFCASPAESGNPPTRRSNPRRNLARLRRSVWIRCPDSARVLLSRLSIFRGDWTSAMAAAVLGAAPDPAALQKLQTACLIVPAENSDPPRWHLPAVVQEAALARLSGRERRRLSSAYAHCVCDAAINAQEGRSPSDAPAYLARMTAEHRHFEAAIQWTLREGSHLALGVRLLLLLDTYCHETNRRALLREWLELALTYRERLPCAAVYALYSALGYACLGGYDHAPAFLAFQEATRRAATVGEAAGIAAAFDSLGVAAHHAAQDTQARAAFEAGLAALPEADAFDSQRGFLLANYAVALSVQNEAARGLVLLEQSLALALRAQNLELEALACCRMAELRLELGETTRAEDDANRSLQIWQNQPGERRRETGECLRLLGEIHLAQAHYAEARFLLRESAAIFMALDKAPCRAAALGLLGDVEFQQGRFDAALLLYEEGLAIWERAEHPRWQAIFLLRLAQVACQQRHFERASALCEASLAFCATANSAKTTAAALRLQSQILPQCGSLRDPETKAAENWILFRRPEGRSGAEKALKTLTG